MSSVKPAISPRRAGVNVAQPAGWTATRRGTRRPVLAISANPRPNAATKPPPPTGA